MLKVGVIGMKGIGRQHSDAYRSHAESELVCVCDKIAERADEAAQAYDVKAYYDAAEMLKNERLDIVGVCTGGFENGGDHFEPTMQALEAGCHVLCEKPLSNQLDEARQMVLKAREKGVCFGTNLNHRFTPHAAMAKEWMTSGRLGEPLLMNMVLWIDNPNETSPWFHLRALHPHSIDIMRYFCGEVARVQAFLKKAPGRVCWSNAQINVQFADGTLGHLTGSYDAAPRHGIERCEVMGSKGRFVIENVLDDLVWYPRDSDEVEHTGKLGGLESFGDTFPARIQRFIDQVVAGAKPDQIEASGADGFAAQAVIEAAIKSHETGSVVATERVEV
jgi:predicted dehydrogenase